MPEVHHITPEIVTKLKTVYTGHVLHHLDFGYILSVEEIIRDSYGNELSRVVRDIDGSNEWGLHRIFDDIVYHPYNYKFLIRYPHNKWEVLTTEELDILYKQVNEVLALVETHKEDNRRRINNE